VETSGGSERSSWFRNAARALFSSYVVPFSRCLVSPFSRLSVGQQTFSPLSNARRALSASNFFAPRQSSPRRSIDPMRCNERTTKMQGSFLHVRGERPHVLVSAICSKNSQTKPARRFFLGISHINRKSSRINTLYGLHVLSSVNYHFIQIITLSESLFANAST